MSTQRDVSGLFNTPDRSPGIAPPPRPKIAAPTPHPAPAVDEPDADSDSSAVTLVGEGIEVIETAPDDTAVAEADAAAVITEPPEPLRVVAADPDQTVRLGLSFTADQLDWLRKQSLKADLWMGEFFDDLFATHADTVQRAGLPRPRRSRQGQNYVGQHLILSPVTAAALDDLSTDLNRSRAAVGRAIVATAMAA